MNFSFDFLEEIYFVFLVIQQALDVFSVAVNDKQTQ